MPKVIVGMSGGVDSSVTAYLLREQGYEVEGLSFILWEARSGIDFTTRCSLQAMGEASNAALHLGIPHSTIDIKDDFIEKVIEPFVNAYTSGLTPNPCVLCNRFIKFSFLMIEAEKRGAEYISTGHYAKVEIEKSIVNSHQSLEKTNDQWSMINDTSSNPALVTRYLLKKGIDPKKDQSYVLYILRQEELKRLILPLGYYRKDEIRKIAYKLGLPAANRHESKEICFIEERNYFKFIERLSPVAGKPGPILDMTGRVIGTHKGIHEYTIGQRKGLGISSPEPLYVVKIDALRNMVYVGPQEAAKKKEFFVKDLNWIIPIWERGEASPRPYRASVKVRSMMKDEPATLFLVSSQQSAVSSKEQGTYALPDIVRVVFDEPQWAPAAGQSAVFYNGDVVMGGGVIT
jgi:tRNA-specific 2-thiouridylase